MLLCLICFIIFIKPYNIVVTVIPSLNILLETNLNTPANARTSFRCKKITMPIFFSRAALAKEFAGVVEGTSGSGPATGKMHL